MPRLLSVNVVSTPRDRMAREDLPTRPCGRSQWRDGAYFGGSVLTVTHRAIWPVRVENIAL